MTRAALEQSLTALVDEGAMVVGTLVENSETTHYCDAENLEILLRMQRAASRPQLKPIAIEAWPGFTAAWQRVGISATENAVHDSLARLQGYPASAAVWLNDLLSSRHRDFADHQLDAAVADHAASWAGVGVEQITFAPPGEVGLVRKPGDDNLAALFNDPRAGYGFFQLADSADASLETVNGRLWSAVWSGTVTADSLAPLRAGLMRKFELSAAPPQRAPRRLRRGQANTLGWPGTWHQLVYPETDEDPISALETDKERVRILIDRYGVVTRELANREGGVFAWRRLFRALRVMELAGEIVAGLFVSGFSGPQFAHPGAARQLLRTSAAPSFWINATDPLSPCGLGIEWHGIALPHRRPNNHLAFSAGRLVLVSEAYGKRFTLLDDRSDDDHAIIIDCLQHVLRQRRRLTVETINDERAAGHPFLDEIRDQVDVAADHRGVELRLVP
jgi:ATP-dependent Lhr-like helicase